MHQDLEGGNCPMYIREDDIPRDGGLWPEYAATMLICFSGWEEGVASGELWSFYFRNPRPFRGLDQLLFQMESVMNEVGQPMSWCEERSLTAPRRRRFDPSGLEPVSIPRRRSPYYGIGGLEGARGRLCTVAVRVYCRRHASMQGELRFLRYQEVCFRSALELIRLLRDGLEQFAWKERTGEVME